jgi:hypothetical protein
LTSEISEHWSLAHFSVEGKSVERRPLHGDSRAPQTPLSRKWTEMAENTVLGSDKLDKLGPFARISRDGPNIRVGQPQYYGVVLSVLKCPTEMEIKRHHWLQWAFVTPVHPSLEERK